MALHDIQNDQKGCENSKVIHDFSWQEPSYRQILSQVERW